MVVQVGESFWKRSVGIIFSIGTTSTTTTTMPPPTGPCRFQYPGKGVIDFSFIGRTDAKAAYTDETTRTASNFSTFLEFCPFNPMTSHLFHILEYSYNPCRSFSEGTDCIGVSVCQSEWSSVFLCHLLKVNCLVSKDDKHTYTLGTQESASWNPGSDVDTLPSVNYAYAEKKVTVFLQCSIDGNNEFQAFGEDPVNHFRFQLTHKCACWNECSN